MSDLTLEGLNDRLLLLEGMLGSQSELDDSAPLWMQNVAYPAMKDRQLIKAAWPRQGVLSGLQVTAREVGANMSVDVAAGAAVVAGTDVPAQGSYLFTFDDMTNLTVPAAPGAGTLRRDLVVLQVTDDAVVGDLGKPRGQLAVIAGTATATPVAPPVPPSSIALAELGPIDYQTVQITPALITDRRPMGSGSAPARYTFTNLSATPWLAVPQGFDYVHVRARYTGTAGAMTMQWNGVQGNQYYSQLFQAHGAGFQSWPGQGTSGLPAGEVPGAPNFGMFDTLINQTGGRPQMQGQSWAFFNAQPRSSLYGGLLETAGAVTTLRLTTAGAWNPLVMDIWGEN